MVTRAGAPDRAQAAYSPPNPAPTTTTRGGTPGRRDLPSGRSNTASCLSAQGAEKRPQSLQRPQEHDLPLVVGVVHHVLAQFRCEARPAAGQPGLLQPLLVQCRNAGPKRLLRRLEPPAGGVPRLLTGRDRVSRLVVAGQLLLGQLLLLAGQRREQVLPPEGHVHHVLPDGVTLRSRPEKRLRLRGDLRALCRTVQGNLIHVYWSRAYGQQFTDERKADLELRHVAHTLRRLAETGCTPEAPLTAVRPPGERFVGNCRHFSTLLVAILREQGVPARVRAGFARYFGPGRYEDHWFCQYWHASEARWVLGDPQLDAVQ